MRKHYLHILFFILLLPLGLFSQDIHLSQFFEAPLWRNPSLAGNFYRRLQGAGCVSYPMGGCYGTLSYWFF